MSYFFCKTYVVIKSSTPGIGVKASISDVIPCCNRAGLVVAKATGSMMRIGYQINKTTFIANCTVKYSLQPILRPHKQTKGKLCAKKGKLPDSWATSGICLILIVIFLLRWTLEKYVKFRRKCGSLKSLKMRLKMTLKSKVWKMLQQAIYLVHTHACSLF